MAGTFRKNFLGEPNHHPARKPDKPGKSAPAAPRLAKAGPQASFQWREQARRRVGEAVWVAVVGLLIVELSVHRLSPVALSEFGQTTQSNASAKGELLTQPGRPAPPSPSLAPRLFPAVVPSAPQPVGGAKPFVDSFEKAIDIGFSGRAGGAISAPLDLAAAHRQRGDFARAEEVLKRGLALTEAQGDMLLQRSKVFAVLGELYRATGDLVRAEAMFHGQLELTERMNSLEDHTHAPVAPEKPPAAVAPAPVASAPNEPAAPGAADAAPLPPGQAREPKKTGASQPLEHFADRKAKDDRNSAEALLKAALLRAQEASDREGMARAHIGLAVLSQRFGDTASACASAARARKLFIEARAASNDVDGALASLSALRCSAKPPAAVAQAAVAPAPVPPAPNGPAASAAADVAPFSPGLAREPKKAGAPETLESFADWIKLAAKQEAAGELDGALTSARIAASLAKDDPDKQKAAAVLANLGALYRARDQHGIAEIAYQASLSLYEGIDPASESARQGVAAVSDGLCAVLQARGRYDRAQDMCEKAIQIDEALGRSAALAQDYSDLGRIHLIRSELDLAEAAYLRALNLHKKVQASEGVSDSYAKLAEVAAARNDPDRAAELFRKAIAIDSAANRKRTLALNHANLGALYAWKHDPANACANWTTAYGLLGNEMKPQRERLEKLMREQSCERRRASGTP